MYPSAYSFKFSARRRNRIVTLVISHGFVALISFIIALQTVASVLAHAD